MKRCAVVSAAIVFTLTFILSYVEVKAVAIVCLCFAASLIVALLMKNRLFIFVAVFCLASSVSMLLFNYFGVAHDAAYNGMTLDITATVERRYSDDRYLLKINESRSGIYETDINGKVIFYNYSDKTYSERDIISGQFTVRSPERENSLLLSFFADGAYIQAYEKSEITLIGKEEATFFDISYNLRNYIQTVCRKIGADEGGLILSLLTGNKSDMTDETVNAFKICGLSHIMAVSGLHLSVVTGLAVVLLDKLELERRFRQLLCLGLILFVMTAASFSFSVMRAGIMSALLIFAYSFKRRNDSLNSLGVSVTVICLVNPFAVMDIGFILSVSATFGILIIMPLLYRFIYKIRFKLFRWIIICIAVSVSATIGALPATAFVFSTVSFIGVALCVVTNIFIWILIISGLVFCAVSYVPGLSFVLMHILRFVAKIFIAIVKYCAQFDFAVIDFNPYPLLAFGILLVLLTIIRMHYGKKARKNVFIACISLAFVIAFLCSARLTYTDCNFTVNGKNHSLGIFAQTENSLAVLDCTDMTRAAEINACLGKEDKINLYFVPEYSKERLAVIEYFAQLDKIEKIIIPDIDDKKKYDIIELFKDKETEVILTDGGCSFPANDITVSVYAYEESALILHTSYNKFSAVYLPKTVNPTQASLLPKADMLIMNGKSLSSVKGIAQIEPSSITVYNASYGDISEFKIATEHYNYSVTEVVTTVYAAVGKNGKFIVYGETQ